MLADKVLSSVQFSSGNSTYFIRFLPSLSASVKQGGGPHLEYTQTALGGVCVFPILAPRAIRRTNSSISDFSAIRA